MLCRGFGIGIGILLLTGMAMAEAPRPNFVIIMADDLGYSDIGSYGGEIETPHLDALAENGVRFSNFYNAARCCPSRASLLTGLYPHQAGMGGMITREDDPEKRGPYQGFLNDQCVTLAEALKPAGYKAYHAGKWHVGELPQWWPRKRGFDRYFGLISGASSYYELLSPERVMALDDHSWTPPAEGFYMTDAFTDYAVRFIEEHEGADPFLLYVGYTAPHWPLHAPEEVIDKYRDRYLDGWDALRKERHARQMEMGLFEKPWPLSPRDEEVPAWEDRDPSIDWPLRMAVYAAMVDKMDEGIGRIVETLRAQGALDNTVIMFLSDNGGCAEQITGRKLDQPGTKPGERGSYVAYRRPWSNASNTPFRYHKKWTYEGGNATPFIVHWPAGIAERGKVIHAPGHIIDIMPTCLSLAGADYPETYGEKAITPLEGASLLPVLGGEAWAAPRTLYWEHMGHEAIREGDWKLVQRSERKEWALYNLAEDRTELNDLAVEMPEKAAALLAKYAAWAQRVGVR